MNPDRDALQGLIDKSDVGSAEGLPSVSPHLVDYLREKFRPLPFDPQHARALGISIAEACLWNTGIEAGYTTILDHLEQLAQNKGVHANEPAPSESASTDPRRPNSSRGR